MSKFLFALLFIANCALGAYQLTHQLPIVDQAQRIPMDVERLVLLRERERRLIADAGDSSLPTGSCFRLGPFQTEADLRDANAALAGTIKAARQRSERVTEKRGFWVYLPAFASREAALLAARELAGAGVRDYYVVTGGELENTISLGLFRERTNALRRLDDLRKRGFEPEIRERSEETLMYFLDYAGLEGTAVPWRRVVASVPGVEHRPIRCFG